MASFLSKLARLPPMPGAAPAASPPAAPVAPEPVAPAPPVVEPAPAPAAADESATIPERIVVHDAAFAPPRFSAPPAPKRPASPPAPPAPPSLDELRDRIARIIGRAPAPAPRANPAGGELPFVVEQTERGPLYVRRVRSLPGARVGRVPLVSARNADPAMLALLALDPALAGLDPKGALFIDTETTGLAGGTGTVPFLLGLAWYDHEEGTFTLEQALLRRLGEEGPILALLEERVRKASMLVSYNGKAFDLPLLRTRYVMNRMAAPPEPPHLDLVHVARRIHAARLKSRTLVSLEHEVLGRVRIGDVPGGEIVSCYAHFLRSGDEEALLGVVEHNAADVLAMVALIGLYGEPLGTADEGAPVYVNDGLAGEDLAGAAKTLRRAGALDQAAALAEEAVARGGGRTAVRARGDIAKARGDKARALSDYEALAAEVDDAAVRLELAKLYEHHVKSFARALDVCGLGTGEDDEATAKRKARLRKKIVREADKAAAIAGAATSTRRRRKA